MEVIWREKPIIQPVRGSLRTVWRIVPMMRRFWGIVLLLSNCPLFIHASIATVCYFRTNGTQSATDDDVAIDQAFDILNLTGSQLSLRTVVFQDDGHLNQLIQMLVLCCGVGPVHDDCHLSLLSVRPGPVTVAPWPWPVPTLLITRHSCPQGVGHPGAASVPNTASSATASTAPWLALWPRAVCDVINATLWTDVIIVADHTLPACRLRALLRCLAARGVGTVTLGPDSDGPEALGSLLTDVEAAALPALLVCLQPRDTTRLLALAHERAGSSYTYQVLLACPGERQDDVTHARALGTAVLVLVPAQDTQSQPCSDLSPYPQLGAQEIVARLCSLPTPRVDLLCGNRPACNQSEQWSACGSVAGPGFYVCGQRQWAGGLRTVAEWRSARPRPLDTGHLPGYFTGVNSATLTVASLPAPPFVTNVSRNGSVAYEGLCIDLLDAIAKELNFEYVITQPPDGMYGAPEPGGDWNGMVGMVKRGEVHMAIGPFTITSAREAVVDFTVPFMEDGGGILSRRADPQQDYGRVFSPFTLDVWLATGGMVVVFGLSLFLTSLHGVAGCPAQDSAGTRDHAAGWTMAMALWMVFASLMEQGVVRQPRRLAGRVVLGCWWLFTILTLATYTATLAALLTVVRQQGHVDSIHQVAASGLTPLTLKGTNWETLFTTAEGGVYRDIGERLQTVMTTEEGVQRLRLSGDSVLLYDKNQANYIYSHNCNQMHLAKEVFNANGLGFVIPQKAFFKNALNRIILKLQEGGFLSMWINRWWHGVERCVENQEGSSLNREKRLDVGSIAGVFFAMGAFTLVAILASALQCLHRCLKRNNNPTLTD